jgi:hypothetical protein
MYLYRSIQIIYIYTPTHPHIHTHTPHTHTVRRHGKLTPQNPHRFPPTPFLGAKTATNSTGVDSVVLELARPTNLSQ